MNIKPVVIAFEQLDLHRFHNLVQDWNLEFTQLKPGRLSVNFAQVIDSDVQLGYGHWNIAVRQEGTSPDGMWTFAFPNEVKLFWRNYIVSEASILVYAPNSTINAVSDNGFEVITFSISEKLLFSLASRNKCLDIINNIEDSEVLVTNGQDFSALRRLIHTEMKKYISGQKKHIEEFDRDKFLSGLCALINSSKKSTKKVSTASRLELLVRSETTMLNNLTNSLTIAELAKRYNVSERTLLYTYKKRYDLGPKAFLKVLELNNVYHILREGIDDSIASAARQNGFWHMGQFYRDYKAFFGELPSDTLKKLK